MEEETQISAVISVATRDLIERYVRATGMKKGHLIESALCHHLQALEELPLDAVAHPRLVVTRHSGQQILSRIRTPKPSRALRELMGRRGD